MRPDQVVLSGRVPEVPGWAATASGPGFAGVRDSCRPVIAEAMEPGGARSRGLQRAAIPGGVLGHWLASGRNSICRQVPDVAHNSGWLRRHGEPGKKSAEHPGVSATRQQRLPAITRIPPFSFATSHSIAAAFGYGQIHRDSHEWKRPLLKPLLRSSNHSMSSADRYRGHVLSQSARSGDGAGNHAPQCHGSHRSFAGFPRPSSWEPDARATPLRCRDRAGPTPSDCCRDPFP